MNTFLETTTELCAFIENAPTCYHVAEQAGRMLREQGFQALSEQEKWDLQPGRAYCVTRSGSSIIAFVMPEKEISGFRIIASHSDSPSFKIKKDPEICKADHYVELNIEKYGGMLMHPWFDRPLGLAGRVCIYKDGAVRTVLIDSQKDLLMIPSLAIHMDRNANEGGHISVQTNMLPIFGDETASGMFMDVVAGLAGVEASTIVSTDLFLYDRSKSTIWGASGEYFSSPRLDDQQCAFASLRAITGEWNRKTQSSHAVKLCCIFDNEEVGSGTKQGADSTFLSDVLKRISLCTGHSEEAYLMLLASSFMLSADNAHAVHPNYIDKADPVNRSYMNHGVVVKWNAAQKYTTDAVSAAVFKAICKGKDIPVQDYVNHSDIAGGSTLGNISTAHVSIPCVDIGCAQLAMHSPYETAGVKDTWYMMQAMEAFYDSSFRIAADSKENPDQAIVEGL